MTDKRPSWKDIRNQRRSALFVGRQEQIQRFRANFGGDEPVMIFAVSGEGGVGKSMLLAEFARVASSPEIGALVIVCDENHTTPVRAMQQISECLAAQGLRYERFDEQLQRYQQLREEVERDPGIPRDVLNLLGRGLSDQTARSLRLPFSHAFEDVDPQTADEALDLLTNSVRDRWQSNDARLLRDPESVLTPLLLELLVQTYQMRPQVLMFDVFERTGGTLSAWLRALFRSEYGEFDPRLCFVLAGREPLDQYWTEFDDVLCRMLLEPFTRDETCQYLAKRQIDDAVLVDQIHTTSGGLPALLDLLAATRPQPGQPLRDISEDAVKRFLQWTPEPERRRAALLAAVPRQFNRDILSALLGRPAEVDFAWLSAQSYIRSSGERGRFYHERVRDLMLRYLRNTAPSELEGLHRALAVHFTVQQRLLALESKAAYQSVEWCRLECERVYHTVSMQPETEITTAVSAFFLALRWRWTFSKDIADICQQVVQEVGQTGVREIAERLSSLVQAYDQNMFEDVIEDLCFFDRVFGVDSMVKCVSSAYLGYSYQMLKKYNESSLYLSAAIAGDEHYAWAIIGRGETYRLMERYEDALSDFEQVIEADEYNIRAITNRGETYRSMKRYDEALLDFGRALNIDKDNVAALVSCCEIYRDMKRYDEAIAVVERVEALDVSGTLSAMLRGVIYYSMGRYEDALPLFERFAEFEKNAVISSVLCGMTYQLMGRYEDAIVMFDRVMGLDVDNVWLIVNRGEINRGIGRYEDAIADFDRIISIDENNSWAIAERGKTYRIMGQYEQALADFDRAIEINNRYDWALAERGETYQLMGRYEQALADFDRAIEINGRYLWAIIERAKTYQLIGRYDDALNDYNRAADIDGDNMPLILGRFLAYAAMNRYEEALISFNQVTDLGEIPPTPVIMIVQATRYLLKQQYEEALKELDRAVMIDVGNSLSIAMRGEVYRIMERYEEALADFDRAIALDNHYAWAIAGRGQTYQSMQRYEEALNDFNQAIMLNGQLTWALISRSQIYKMMDRFEEAMSDLNRVLEIDPTNNQAMVERTGLYLSMNEYDRFIEGVIDVGHFIDFEAAKPMLSLAKAVKCLSDQKYEEGLSELEKVEESDVHNVVAIIVHGQIYQLMGRYEEALADFDRAIELDPQNAQFIAVRGETYRAMGRYEEALADFDRAVELDPQNAQFIEVRGETYRAMGRYQEALADFDRVIELDPQDARLIAVRGETYRMIGKYKKALDEFDKAVGFDENAAWIVGCRGRVYMAMGCFEEALADFNRALGIEPNLAWAIIDRGRIYQLMGRYEEALEDFNHIIAMDEHKYLAISERGETYRRMGMFEQAIVEFTRLMSLSGPGTFELHRRAACYRAVGNEEAAQSDLAQALDLPIVGNAADYCNRGVACVLLGRYEEAIELLRRAFVLDDYERIYSQTDDLLDPLRDRPDFQALLAQC